jgi:uncharacterized HAD superfamily protein
MRIGIDIDDVITRTGQIFYQKINERFGTNIEFKQVTSYNLVDKEVEKLGFDMHEFYDFVTDIQMKSLYHEELIVRRGFINTIAKFHKQNHIIYLISNRHVLILPYTTVWLKNIGILPLVTGVLHNTYTKEPYGAFKIREAKRLKLDVFFEDALDYALPLAEARVPVILFDRPWNQMKKLPKNVFRINDWRDVEGVLGKVTKLKLLTKT